MRVPKLLLALVGAIFGAAIVALIVAAFLFAIAWLFGATLIPRGLGWLAMPVIGAILGARLGYNADIRTAIDTATTEMRVWFGFAPLWVVAVVVVFWVFAPFGRYRDFTMWHGHEWLQFLTIALGPAVVGLLGIRLFLWATRRDGRNY